MKEFSKITNTELNEGVASLPLRPNQISQFGQPPLSGRGLQKKFDHLATVIAARFNALIDALSSTDVIDYLRLSEEKTLKDFIDNILIEGDQLAAMDPSDKTRKKLDTILRTFFAAIEAVKTFVVYQEGEQTIADIYATKNDLEDDISSAKEEAISAAGTNAEAYISAHNEDTSAHGDLRSVVSDLKTVVDEFFAEGADNDANLDRLVEIVTLINSNQSAIDTITNKVDVSDIVNNLNTDEAKKPLSAAQGVVLNGLIDDRFATANIDKSTTKLSNDDSRVPSSALVKKLFEADKDIIDEVFLTNGTHGLLYHLYSDTGDAICAGIGNCTETDIEIGSIAKGYPVTKVGDLRESGDDEPMFIGGKKITSLVMPNSVTEICAGAFAWCGKLESVRLSKKLREIPSSAFRGDERLKEIMIPSGVVRIRERAFYSCSSLNKIYLPKSIETIEGDAFYRISEGAVVYYEGSAEDWKILISGGTSGLENATVKYDQNYDEGET